MRPTEIYNAPSLVNGAGTTTSPTTATLMERRDGTPLLVLRQKPINRDDMDDDDIVALDESAMQAIYKRLHAHFGN